MKVVIVGGGFGGVRMALSLANKKNLSVRLISNQPYFEYHAALYRSATGRSPLEVAILLKEFFGYAKNVEVVEDTVVDIDNKSKHVTGESGSRYEYDTVVFALGSVTQYYGIKGLTKYAYSIKTIQEALKLKRTLHQQLLDDQPEQNYVVVGAGASGVELAAELTSYLKRIRKKHRITKKFRVELVEAGPRAVAAMPESFSTAVEKRLKKLGVKTMYKTAVKAETIDSIQLTKGPLRSHTVIWTAGVANNPFYSQFPKLFATTPAGRVVVDAQLQAAPNIFVIGDSAQTQYSGLAQTALHDASFVGSNLVRSVKGKPPRVYEPKRPVYASPVGPRWAAVLWGRVQINGRLGWLLRRLADLRLYLAFLPPAKALAVWRYGHKDEEICPICK